MVDTKTLIPALLSALVDLERQTELTSTALRQLLARPAVRLKPAA